MSFVLRQISRSADGREIVRERRVTKPDLSIGRSPDCDIHLADLAITLHHASLRSVAPDVVEIAAAANLPFIVNGRPVRTARIDAARGGAIRMGGHALTIAPGDDRDIVVTIERFGALSDGSAGKDEERVFSLASVAPSKRAGAWAFALLILLAALAWPIWSFHANRADARAVASGTAPPSRTMRPAGFHPDEMWSSGKLSKAHANLEGNCQACHVEPFVAVRDDACIACHAQVHGHADPARIAAARPAPGAAARLQLAVSAAFNKPQGGCVGCHTEHEGAGAMPATAQRFCTDCHASLDSRLHDTRLKHAGDFGTDHPEFRPAILTGGPDKTDRAPAVQRISLAAHPREDSGLKFPHRLHLSTTNGVARMAQTLAADDGFGRSLACKDCHVADATGTSFKPVEMEGDCAMCHSLAFDRVEGTVRTLRHGDPNAVVADLRAFYRSGGPIRAVAAGGAARHRPGEFANYRAGSVARAGGADAAIRAVFSPGGACFDCHRVILPAATGTGTFGIVPVRLTEHYLQKGWFDHGAHDTQSCEGCHAAKTSDTSADVLLPGIATCRSCHGGEHAKRAVPSSCAMCHDYHVTSGAPRSIRDDRRRGRGHHPPPRQTVALR
jgi:hypothetical protein